MRDRPARPSAGRFAAEMVALARPAPFPVFPAEVLRGLPRGDGHAVMVLPGIARGDGHTARLRAFLVGLGYAAHGWDAGVDLGPMAGLIRKAEARLAALHEAHGPVSLVGISMGGLFARLLAVRYPARVRRVITVCSPIDRPAQSVRLPLEPVLGLWPGVDLRALAAEIAARPTVPATCIYSRDDGLVSWESCRASDDDVAVSGCHVTMASNPEALLVIADRLARPAGRA